MLSVELKNVLFTEDVKKAIETRCGDNSYTVRAHSLLEPVIRELALLKPTWKFEATSMQRDSPHEFIFYLTNFEVREDNEVLGSIMREYGRTGYKIKVVNERINSKRERGSGYMTDDPKKAITRVKKEFGRMTPVERLGKASEAAAHYAYHATNRHGLKVREHEVVVREAATSYVMGAGFTTFLEYLKENTPSSYDKVLQANTQYSELKAEMSVLEDIRNKLGTDKSALIVRDFEQYIVRIGNKVELYDDTTLPVELRGKLGLLKLVEKEHFVSGAGCRVSDEVFVVVLDDSQGEEQ